MKKSNNNKGYFIMETIIVISLVATIMAYVYPNINAVYENYKYQATMYDQTEDVQLLNAIYQKKKDMFIDKTTGYDNKTNNTIYIYRGNDVSGKTTRSKEISFNESSTKTIHIDWFVIGYTDTPRIMNRTDGSGNTSIFDYDPVFNRYVARLHRQIYDDTSNRLIARIQREDKEKYTSKITYASVKIVANSVPSGYTRMRYIRADGSGYIATKLKDEKGLHAVLEYSFPTPHTINGKTYDGITNFDAKWINITGTNQYNGKDIHGNDKYGRSYIAVNNVQRKIEGSMNNNVYFSKNEITNSDLCTNLSTNCPIFKFEISTYNGYNVIFNINSVTQLTEQTKPASEAHSNSAINLFAGQGYSLEKTWDQADPVMAPGILYSAKYYDENDNIIRYFVPIKDKNGECALYDIVNGGEPYYVTYSPYAKDGSGFVCGN